MEKFKPAAVVNKALLNLDPSNKELWRQLFSIYSQIENTNMAQVALQTYLRIDKVPQESDIRMLANIFVELGQPWQSARLVKASLEKKILKNTAKNYLLLGHGYWQAKETSLAISALDRSAQLAKSAKTALQAGQIAIEAEQWQKPLLF